MAFPTLRPTARDFTAGDYPVKSFKAQSGAEVRILYGSERTDMQLRLSYENITDSNAESFLTHYDSVQGTFSTFNLPSTAFTGWSGSGTALDVTGNNEWRYQGPPQVTNVRPGISTVTVDLIGVL